MSARREDGSAGDANYGVIGATYSRFRQPDERIAAVIHRALGDARTVLNVGAGAGSYEPVDREVTPVEPSASMRAQRPPHLAPAIDAVAEKLPFADKSFDAAMATFTVHQWPDLGAGLHEMRRVTRGPVVVMSCAPDEVSRFWLNDYAPEALATEARRYPPLRAIAEELGGEIEIISVPIPLDCADGFNEAYYGRPEMLLNPAARLACSAWSFVSDEATQRFETTLRNDLASGAWDRKYGHLRAQSKFGGSLKLVISRIGA
ncbi:class I SAM-dependent methyltransferase [Terrarubrum flagellatum]|uniref:class I SAM-dependent methyltransferase n=1 Tax=Terrirubrum flagellatum TaxID=2895980 RepID=UPI003144EDFA